MTKKYIVPCVIDVSDEAKGKSIRLVLGKIGIFLPNAPDNESMYNAIGVEIDFDKMQQLAKQNGEEFDRDKFLKDFTDSVREALNSLVNGELR